MISTIAAHSALFAEPFSQAVIKKGFRIGVRDESLDHSSSYLSAAQGSGGIIIASAIVRNPFCSRRAGITKILCRAIATELWPATRWRPKSRGSQGPPRQNKNRDHQRKNQRTSYLKLRWRTFGAQLRTSQTSSQS